MNDDWYGINYPFGGGVQNVLSKQIGIRIIKNDIMQLFFTNPGERVYRPTYGIGIRMFLFDQLDDISISSLRSTILNQVSIHEPRVSIDSLDITDQKDLNTLIVKTDFSLIQNPNEKFDITLNLPIFENDI